MDNFRVLVVDDETDFLETIVKRLRKRGLEVEGVPKGEAAVEMIKVRRGHERQKDRRQKGSQKGSQKGVGHRRGSHRRGSTEGGQVWTWDSPAEEPMRGYGHRRGSSLDMGQSCGGTHARLLSHVQT
jgi:hypothetical protein